MHKEVLFGSEARQKLVAGVKKITDAVRVTMGASGKCVLISNGAYGDNGVLHFPTIVSKDGHTVAKHFSLPDPLENRGAILIKEAATKTVEMAGDATTCTCVIADYLIREGMKLVNEGANSQELRRGIDAAVEDVVKEIALSSTNIRGSIEKIRQLATVSANNESSIGDLIADAYEKIGDDGVIDIEAGSSRNTEIKISEGYKFDRGWISPLFINRREKQICEFENPLILLYEKRINHYTQIQKAMELAVSIAQPLVIICEEAEQQGLAVLAMNNMNGRLPCCAISAPGFGDIRREMMEDIALLTGATYFADNRGVDIKRIKEDQFGTATKVIISKDETVIIEGKGDKSKIEDHVNELRMNLAGAKAEEDKLPIEQRIASIKGSVAVIRVGGTTQTEMNERKDRVDDAVKAVRSAISEGYIAGGGTALVRIADKISSDITKTSDFDKGKNLVIQSLLEPVSQMAKNAGHDHVEISDIVLRKCAGNNGYNVRTAQFEDMVESGIIDSAKAIRCAIQNAASVAGMLLTSECCIYDQF